MLSRQTWREAPSQFNGDNGQEFRNEDFPTLHGHQSGPEQRWKISGQPDILSRAGGTDQTEQLGDGAGPYRGYPEPTHIWIRGIKPAVTFVVLNRDCRSDSYGWPG